MMLPSLIYNRQTPGERIEKKIWCGRFFTGQDISLARVQSHRNESHKVTGKKRRMWL
jgi:hypothetical protein